MKYVIISHERAARLAKLTIPLLQRLEVDLDDVAVLVDEPQISWYTLALPSEVHVVKGALGAVPNRNASMDLWPVGTPVVAMDDDLQDIKEMGDDGKWHPITPFNFHRMLNKGFYHMDELDGGLWGINNIHNDLWARRMPELQVGMPMIEGPFFGFWSGEPFLFMQPEAMYDDTERCCQVFANGRNVIKLNRFAHWQSASGEGGVADRTTAACEGVRRLQRLYPRLIDHTDGRQRHRARCRAWPKRGRYVSNPESIADVDAMRARVAVQAVKEPDLTVHDS